MKKILVTVLVVIDEQRIEKKYPNFEPNYENTEQGLLKFASNLLEQEESMLEFGFGVYVENVEDTDSIGYQRTQNILQRYDSIEYWDNERFE